MPVSGLKKNSIESDMGKRIASTDSLLSVFLFSSANNFEAEICNALREDRVVLLKGVEAHEADLLMANISNEFGLKDALEIQSGFASIHGHRENSGKYYMSVNKRKNYEFIPPHSEGTSSINMQLASFYCHENTTDGGETILLNTKNSSDSIWDKLREKKKKARLARTPTPEEIAQAKVMFQLDLREDILHDSDEIIHEHGEIVPGLELFDVLSAPQKTRSKILNENVYTFWDSIASVDYESSIWFHNYLKENNLLKLPHQMSKVEDLDNAWNRKVWRSEADVGGLFGGEIVYKLQPGDFIILNNLTWVHSTNNWTPNSGVRHVVAAFA